MSDNRRNDLSLIRELNHGILFSKWDDFKLSQLTENNYGIEWPIGTAQVTKELMCFKLCREKRNKELPKMLSTFEHFLNIVQLLWNDSIDIYKDVPRGRIWNNYFLDISQKLCGYKKKRTILCGPASANKTYITACYAFCCYLSAPNETLVMVSTTSGSASERRIWADIKDFYRKAKFKECGIEAPGEIIEYLKAITFDPEKQLGGSDRNSRDFRNGIIVIPIANDSGGDTALDTIQGSKNTHVIWILDEMAQMQDGVTRPNRNLGANPYFQFIGIGNSKSEQDPHGKECMPKEGLEGLDVNIDREWISAKGADILFLHGEETPNNHPLIDQDEISQISDFPFPYCSNRIFCREVAEDCGDGNIEAGKLTIDYWKFCIGFWAPLEATSSLYSKNLITSHNAHLQKERLMNGIRGFGAGDFAFTADGDDNTFMGARIGYNQYGKKIINFDPETVSIKVKASSKEEFIKATAIEYVHIIKSNEIEYEDFGGDTGNDAAMMLNEMSREAKTHDFVGISSIGEATNKKKYKNKVTELWFQARDLIRTGMCRGINPQSKYFAQLCSRKYESLNKNFYQIERKKDMKKRTGRSPDDADAFIYLCHMIIRSGLVSDELSVARAIKDKDEEREEARNVSDPYARIKEEYKNEESFQLTEIGEEDSDYENIF